MLAPDPERAAPPRHSLPPDSPVILGARSPCMVTSSYSSVCPSHPGAPRAVPLFSVCIRASGTGPARGRPSTEKAAAPGEGGREGQGRQRGDAGSAASISILRLSSEELTCQGRGCGFAPWVGRTPWRRKQHPTPVISAWRTPQTEEPGGLQSMGSQRVEHDWATKQLRNSTPEVRGGCSNNPLEWISISRAEESSEKELSPPLSNNKNWGCRG